MSTPDADPSSGAAAPAPEHAPRPPRGFVWWSLLMLNGVAVLFLLKWADTFFIPFVAGIFLSYTLGPIVDVLQRRLRLPRALGAAIAVLGFVGVIGGIGYAVWWQALDLAESLPQTVMRMNRTTRQAQADKSSVLNTIQEAAKAVDSALQNVSPSSPKAAAAAPAPAAPREGVSTLLLQKLLAVFGSLGTLGSVLLLAYFLLAAGDSFRRKTVSVIGTRLQHKRITVELLNHIQSSVQKYLGSLFVTNLALGLLTYAALLAQGFENARVWGALGGLLHVIPYVGPLLTAIGVFVTGMQQWSQFTPALLAAASTLAISTFVGIFAQTWLLGRVANINHTAQFVALLFFGWLWGALGLLIAIPMAVVLKVVAEHIEPLSALKTFLQD